MADACCGRCGFAILVTASPPASRRIPGSPWPAGRRLAVLALLFLAGCGIVVERDGPPRRAVDSSRIPDAVPRAEPKSRYGNPESYVVNGKRYYTLDSSRGFRERGIASWYGRKFHGRRTSSGEVYDMNTMTAAHKSLPLPTYVEVTELTTGRRVVVRVNDRGPFYPNRVIDLSYAAARKLGISERGTGLVEIRAIEPGVVAVASAPAESRRIGRDNVRMYLQIGAFVSRANAERLQARIRNMVGVAIRVTPAVSGGRSVYRVRLGPLVDVEHADRVAEQIARFGLGEPRVVIE